MKNIFVVIGVLIIALALVSCAGVPKSQDAAPVSELYAAPAGPASTVEPPIPEETVPEPVAGAEPEAEPEYVPEVIADAEPSPEDIPESVAGAEPIPEYVPEVIAGAEPIPEDIPEPVAEAEPEAEPEYIPEVIADAEPMPVIPEPEVPVIAEAVAEEPGIKEMPDIETPGVRTLPPLPPPAASVSQVPPSPEPVSPPPVPPPPAPPPEDAAESPAPVREPIPRIVPDSELPYPNPGVGGWQKPAAESQLDQSSPPDEAVNFSRIVRATAGQLVEIPFRGTGWVYLGEAASRRGIVYESRKLDSEGQSFVFRTELAGTYTLAFYRQDFIRNFFLNDHVQVVVGDAAEAAGTGWFNPSADRGRVVAEPRWPSSLEEAQALRGNHPVSPDAQAAADPVPVSPPPADRPPESSPAGTVVQRPVTPPSSPGEAPASPPALTGDEAGPPAQAQPPASFDLPQYNAQQYLSKAKEEFDAGRVASAISLLDQLVAFPSADSQDELYWLYGQFYEANSPSRNIRLSLDYYRRLINEYPQSDRCNDAQRRISYLERYYINNR